MTRATVIPVLLLALGILVLIHCTSCGSWSPAQAEILARLQAGEAYAQHGNNALPAAAPLRQAPWENLPYGPGLGGSRSGGPSVRPPLAVAQGVGLLSHLPGVGVGLGGSVVALGVFRAIAAMTRNKLDDAVSRQLDQGAASVGLPVARPPDRGVA